MCLMCAMRHSIFTSAHTLLYSVHTSFVVCIRVNVRDRGPCVLVSTCRGRSWRQTSSRTPSTALCAHELSVCYCFVRASRLDLLPRSGQCICLSWFCSWPLVRRKAKADKSLRIRRARHLRFRRWSCPGLRFWRWSWVRFFCVTVYCFKRLHISRPPPPSRPGRGRARG